MTIKPLTSADETAVQQIVSLISALRERKISAGKAKANINAIIADKSRCLIAATNNQGDIVGMAIVNILRSVERIGAKVDDVVVDESSRGQGLGRGIMQAALDWAWDQGCRSLELTSRPSREAANHLYQKMGFTLRETNAYSIKNPRVKD